jgi:hypothetical protein
MSLYLFDFVDMTQTYLISFSIQYLVYFLIHLFYFDLTHLIYLVSIVNLYFFYLLFELLAVLI